MDICFDIFHNAQRGEERKLEGTIGGLGSSKEEANGKENGYCPTYS